MDVKKITYVQNATSEATTDKRPRAYVNFVGGTFIEVLGTVDEIGLAIRLHRR